VHHCAAGDAAGQGLTIVYLSAQREHFLSHVVSCFAGFSDKKGSGSAKMLTSVSPCCWGGASTAQAGRSPLILSQARQCHLSLFPALAQEKIIIRCF